MMRGNRNQPMIYAIASIDKKRKADVSTSPFTNLIVIKKKKIGATSAAEKNDRQKPSTDVSKYDMPSFLAFAKR